MGANQPAVLYVGSRPMHGGGAAHDRERHQKGVLASYEIPDASEEEGTERTDEKTDGEGGEIGDVRESVVAGRIEFRGKDGGEAAEDVEVVPLDHGADGGGEDYAPDAVFGAAAHRDCVCSTSHTFSCTDWLR